MTPFAVLSLQSTLSLIAFALLAKWHVVPRLAERSPEAAVAPLLWVHVFRYAPLTLLAPGQADARIPADVVAVIAYGDLAASILAFVALIAVRLRARSALGLIWLFSAFSIADLVVGTERAVSAELYRFYIGWSWYIVTFYVPMLLVSQGLIVWCLLKHRPREVTAVGPALPA